MYGTGQNLELNVLAQWLQNPWQNRRNRLKKLLYFWVWHSVVLIQFHQVQFVERMFQSTKRIVAKILYFIIPIDIYLSSLFVQNVHFYPYLVMLLEGSKDAHVPMQFQSIHTSEYCWPSSVHLFQSFISCSLICRSSWLTTDSAD